MSIERTYTLQPVARNSLASDVHQLLLTLNVAEGEVYLIDNLKKINRVDPPMLVHASDGRLIKIRSFSSELKARTFLDFLGNEFWPHTGIVLGRCGRAIAENWLEGEVLSDNKYHPDYISSAGAALGSLHAPRIGHGARGVGWMTASHWVSSTSNRICRLSRLGFINEQERKQLLQLVDHYAPDTVEYGLTHGDFAPDNLLVDAQGRLFCIDNETACVGALDYDLTRTILRWPLSGTRRRAFLRAYSAYRDLRPTAHQSPFWLVAVLVSAVEWECQHLGAPSERKLRCLHRVAAPERLGRSLRAKSSVKFNNRLSLRFLGSRIEVFSEDRSLLAWLEEFLAPHFAVGCDQRHEIREAWSVEMRTSEADYCELETACARQEHSSIPAFLRDDDWEYVRDCGERGEERLFLRDAHEIFYGVNARIQRVRVYRRKANPTSRVAAMKVVREVGMRELWHDGKLMLHAAAFAAGGNGCLILGPKGAGKTTLLTYLLQSGGVSYLTNDRAALVETETGFSIRGIPTIVSVRSGTTSLFPFLHEGQKRLRYRHLQTREEAQNPDLSSPVSRKMLEEPDLSPSQYTTHLQCRTTAEARLAAVIIPNVRISLDGFGPFGFHMTRLDSLSARTEIEDAFFGPAKGWPGGGMIPPMPTLPTYLALHRERMVKNIVRGIPCFRVDINEVAFQTANLAASLNLLAGSPIDPASEYAMS